MSTDPHPDRPNSPNLDAAHRALRACYLARLAIADRFEPLEVALDPSSGTWIAPIAFDAIGRDDLTLFLPEDLPSAARVLVEAREIDADAHPGADRHRAFHPSSKGRFTRPRWVALSFIHAKIASEVYAAEDLDLADPWGAPALARRGDPPILDEHGKPLDGWRAEARLLKRLNDPNQPALDLARACAALARVDIPSPRALGADPWGLDVRASLGMVRVELPRRATSPDDLLAVLRAAI